jgi:hypothetical protein
MLRLKRLLFSNATAVGIALGCTPFLLFAEETISEFPNVFTLSASWDSDDGNDYYFDADIGISDGHRLYFSAGMIEWPDDDQINPNLDPVNFLLGFENHPYIKIPLGVEYEYWGEDEEVTVDTLRGSVGYNTQYVYFEIQPQMRDFNIFFANDRKLDFSSKGFTLGIDINALDNVSVGFKYAEHDYNELALRFLRALAATRPLLAQYMRLRLINTIGLQDKIYTLDATCYFQSAEIGAYWLQSRSAIDDAVTDAYGANIGIYFLDDWSLDVQLGSQSTEGYSDEFNYGTVSLSYYY